MSTLSQSIPLDSSTQVPGPSDVRESQRGRLAGFALTLAASLGSFLFFGIQGILLARLLGPEMRGAFAATVLFPQALQFLGLLGASELMAGYAARGMPNVELRRTAARYGLLAGIVSLGLCLLLDVLLIPAEFRQVLPLALLCAVALPLQQIRLSIQAVDHGQRMMVRYNVTRIVAAAAFPATLAVGACFGLSDVKWCCIWFVVSQFVPLALSQWGMQGSWFGEGAVPVRSSLLEARGLMVAWLANEALERLDVLILLLVATRETMGFYAAAVPMAAAMIIIPNSLGLYVFNRGARSEEIPTPRTAWKFILGALGIQLVVGLVFGLTLPYFVHILYGKDFSETVVFAWLLLPAGAFKGLLQAADSYVRARGKPMLGIRARLMCIPILLLSALVGYQYFGVYAIPFSLSLTQCICFVLVVRSALADIREHAHANPLVTPSVVT